MEKTNNDVNNAWICFGNNKNIQVSAIGKYGLFFGYISLVEGIFSVAELQQNSNEKQIFITDIVDVEVGKLSKNKHVICIAENFIVENNIQQNATLITNVQPIKLSLLLYCNENFNKLCNKKCAIFFPEDINSATDSIFQKIEDTLNRSKENIYDFNFLDTLKVMYPFFLKKKLFIQQGPSINIINLTNNGKLPVLHKKRKKKIAIIDFGILPQTKNILNIYFECIFLPYTEKAKDIFYLYEDKKIDGVVLSNSICNTNFVSKNIISEITKILNSKIPVLGIEFGAVLIAEIFKSNVKIYDDIFCYDEYQVINFEYKMFYVSNLYYKKIVEIPPVLHQIFFDQHNYVAGFTSYEKKIIGYNFSFFSNNSDVTFLLNEFYKIMR